MSMITIRAYGALKTYTSPLPAGGELDVAEGTRVGGVLAQLNVPADTRLVVLVNGRPAAREHLLHSGDLLVIYPPLEGG